MIAVSSSGKSFRALAAYLATGRTGEERDRVAWSTSRNLPTDDPELAATFMRATAAKSDRVEKPVYHVILSFDPGDSVDRAAMEHAANRILDRLGLGEHQAVVVAHRDREHAHVHLLVNRVHPETGRAWERWKDQPLIQQVLREEEAALGLRPVASSLEPPKDRTDALELDLGDARPSPGAATHTRRHSREASEQKIEELGRDLATYERVETVTRELYATKAEAEAARARLTQLDGVFDRARKADESFLTALRLIYREPIEAKSAFTLRVAEVGIDQAARTLREHPEQFGELLTVEKRQTLGFRRVADDGPARHAAPEAARLGILAISAAGALATAESEVRIRRLERAFERDLRALFENPSEARRQFEALAKQHGADHAALRLTERPQDLGVIRPSIQRDPERLAAIGRSAADAGLALAQARSERLAENALLYSHRIGIPWPEAERTATGIDARASGERERATREELKRLPSSAELRQRIVNGIARLLPHELRRMKLALSAPHVALAMKLRSTVREVLIGRDDDRSA